MNYFPVLVFNLSDLFALAFLGLLGCIILPILAWIRFTDWLKKRAARRPK